MPDSISVNGEIHSVDADEDTHSFGFSVIIYSLPAPNSDAVRAFAEHAPYI